MSAEKDARNKCREGIAPAGSLCLETGCHDMDRCVVRPPACNWAACRRTTRADSKCFAWCKCRCHSRVIPSARGDVA